MEIAIVSASAATVTIVAVYCMFVMGKRAADAERRAGAAEVKTAATDARLLITIATMDTYKAKASDLEKTNASLTELLAEAANDLAPDGARARLHAKWFALSSASGAPTGIVSGTVHVPAGPKAPGPDDLIKPGE